MLVGGETDIRNRFERIFMAIFTIIMLPYVVTVLINGMAIKANVDNSRFYVRAVVGSTEKKVPWEEYFIGTLAKEMDISYGDEAWKAQAVVTRTNLYRIIERQKKPVVPGSYMTFAQMKQTWGDEQAERIYRRLKQIADDTENEVLLHNGKLVSASFHRLSNGKTRDGREVLGGESYPYLKTKDCPKDVESEYQLQTLTLTYDEAKEYCRPFLTAVGKEESERTYTFEDFEIKALDQAGYVTKIRIGKNIYPGEEFRNALELPSSCFTLKDQNGNLKITTKGIGHGIGMSQYTANEMAKDGKTYEEILQYFYEGTEIKEAAEILLNVE